jgi:hypothetical protein
MTVVTKKTNNNPADQTTSNFSALKFSAHVQNNMQAFSNGVKKYAPKLVATPSTSAGATPQVGATPQPGVSVAGQPAARAVLKTAPRATPSSASASTTPSSAPASAPAKAPSKAEEQAADVAGAKAVKDYRSSAGWS